MAKTYYLNVFNFIISMGYSWAREIQDNPLSVF